MVLRQTVIEYATATHSNSQQLTATHCNSLQLLTATHCTTLQHTATRHITIGIKAIGFTPGPYGGVVEYGSRKSNWNAAKPRPLSPVECILKSCILISKEPYYTDESNTLCIDHAKPNRGRQRPIGCLIFMGHFHAEEPYN